MQKDPVFNNHLTFVLTKTSEGKNKVFFLFNTESDARSKIDAS